MQIPTPSWLLVFWCGLCASIASEWLMAAATALVSRPSAARRAGTPRFMTRPRGSIPFALVSGTLVFAPLYGLAFEWWRRANVASGALLGVAHGVLAGSIVLFGLLRRRAREPREATLKPMLFYRGRRLLTRVLYGALMGFLYVVPPLH